MMKLKVILPLIALLLLSTIPAQAAPLATLTFINCSNNIAGDVTIGINQMRVDVSDPGGGQVLFTFRNIGPAASSITQVYFDDGSLLGIASLIDADDGVGGDPGVDYSPGATPPDLPSGNTCPGSPFQVTAGFSADADPPTQPNGVNPLESLGILFTLQGGQTVNDVLNELTTGDLRIGFHVQGYASGGSEAFVNTPPQQTGSLEVTKVVDWNGVTPDQTQTFEICISGPSYPNGDEQGACQTADYDGAVLTWNDLDLGEYTVSETDPGDLWTVEVTGSPATVEAGQTAQAEVTNSLKTGTITIVKEAPGGGSTLFHFEGDLGLMALADGSSGTQYDIPVGDYTVTETMPLPDGWALTDVTCVGGDSTPVTDGVTIHLDAGEHITCTFTNTKEPPQPGTIIVEKQTDPDGAPDTFTFSGDASGTIADGGEIVVLDLPPGTYTSQETVPADWKLTSIVCDDTNSGGDVNTATATFQLEAGETVRCVFNNREEEPSAITLASFEVEANDGRAMMMWETGTEIDNAGFNLYRALSPDGPWTKINTSLIAAEGDPISGASYTFVDKPGRGAFYYRLEDVDYFGLSTLHTPVLAELGAAVRAPWFRPLAPDF